jgi:hypothetical protein
LCRATAEVSPLPDGQPDASGRGIVRGKGRGPSAAAAIFGVARQTIYDWISERRVERLLDALRLSRASGVPIENLAGDDVEKLAAPIQTPSPKRRGRKPSPDSPGL